VVHRISQELTINTKSAKGKAARYPSSKAARHLSWIIVLLLLLAPPLFAQDASTILGPDGNYYPDWRGVGVQSGTGGTAGSIPVVTSTIAVISATAAGANLAGAIQTAVTSASTAGLIVLPTGTYNLTQPVFINKNGIVISGGNSSNNGTIINFTWPGPTSDTPVFFQPVGQTTLYQNTWLSIQANPVGLTQLDIYAGPLVGGTFVPVTYENEGSSQTFSLDCSGYQVYASQGSVSGTYRVVAEAWYGSVEHTATNSYYVSSSYDSVATDPTFYPLPGETSYLGAFNFSAPGNFGSSYNHLALTGSQGLSTIQVTNAGITAGDYIDLYAPDDQDFIKLTGNTCGGGWFRENQFVVTSATGTTINLNQPLRIPFPVDPLESGTAAPYVTILQTIQNCGVQNLTLNQTAPIWTSGFLFSWAWNCWVNNIVVNEPGRFPVWFAPAKWCEVNNCTFDGAWYLNANGTGYVGFERAYDCLMQGVTSSNLRHGPLLQWSSSGDVIRNSTFTDTDPQWHAGWANNNLYENNIIMSNLLAETPDPNSGLTGCGSYGDTSYASAPSDDIHGPEGPYNVIYNNDISGPAYGIFMGGANDGWFFLWNRFAVDGQDGNGAGSGYYNQGPCLGFGMYFQQGSAGHLVEHNAFLLEETPFAVDISDTNSVDNLIVNNTFAGSFNPTYSLFIGAEAPGAGSTGNTTTDVLQQSGTFPNGGFETADLTDWVQSWDGWSNNGMDTVTAAAAFTGTCGLQVLDTTGAGNGLASGTFGVSAGYTYACRFMYKVNSGPNDCGVYLDFLNSGGNVITTDCPAVTLSSTTWMPAMVSWEAPSGAVTARVWIHSFSSGTCNVYLDDFEFGAINKLANQQVPFDSGFEGGGVGWSGSNDNGMSTIVPDLTDTNSHNHILQVADKSTTLGADYVASCPATPYQEYEARFSGAVLSGSSFTVSLNFYNSSGTYLYSQSSVTLLSETNWRQYVVRGYSPGNTATLQLAVTSSVAGTGTAIFDNFTVLQLPARPVPEINYVDIPSIYQWEQKPVYPLNNMGFENGNFAYWSIYTNGGDNGMSAVTSAAAYTGSYGLQVTDTSATLGSSVMSDTVPAAPNMQFNLSYMGKQVSGSGTLGVYLQFVNSAGTVVAGGNNEIPLPTSDTSWSPLSQTFTAPAGTAAAQIWIHSDDSGVVTAYIDDLQLTQVIPPP
jgi:hypothetical protein